ncbi:hypothetical protein niasHT_028765 [Heterodera trifolii]|uniref:Uncharacterized protein n=1 Tax=Heterodera trifolii TaxID=157864 RepID=A0ABD2KQC0_9BILA
MAENPGRSKKNKELRKMPIELIAESTRFIRFSRKWANCRVSHSFDHFLLEKHGNWLNLIKELVTKCASSITSLTNRINEIPDGLFGGRTALGGQMCAKRFEAERLYIALVDCVNNCPSFPDFADLIDLGLIPNDANYTNRLLECSHSVVQDCIYSHDANLADLKMLDMVLRLGNSCISHGYKIGYGMV